MNLEIVSGGNSSSYYLLERGDLPAGINNLRIGEIFVCGNETAFGNRVPGTYDDVFVLEAEIVELKRNRHCRKGKPGWMPSATDRYMKTRAR